MQKLLFVIGCAILCDIALPLLAAPAADKAIMRAAALQQLGHDLFFAPALSGSGKMSCASCHDPAYGFTPPNDLAVQKGGSDLTQFGTRAVPTLKYLQATPAFSEHHLGTEDDGGQENLDQGPAGGLTWDGRAERGRDQARIPLLSPVEMANQNEAETVKHVLAAGFSPRFAALFGAHIAQDPARFFAAITEAIEVFEQDQDVFFPYSSKFDYWLEGKAKFTAQEQRGYEAFIDPARGNCDSCHKASLLPNGGHPDLTDFGLVAVALPRNREIPANSDPTYYDLGACGPLRQDLADKPELCGIFKTPTLRNAALKKRFFHNGFIKTLRDAVRFYAERDSHPELWYPKKPDGRIDIYNDLPPRYRGNINRDPPLDVKPGDKPHLSARDIDDITAFIGTLTDGYRSAP
jgi:cytochrome c peroxidase